MSPPVPSSPDTATVFYWQEDNGVLVKRQPDGLWACRPNCPESNKRYASSALLKRHVANGNTCCPARIISESRKDELQWEDLPKTLEERDLLPLDCKTAIGGRGGLRAQPKPTSVLQTFTNPQPGKRKRKQQAMRAQQISDTDSDAGSSGSNDISSSGSDVRMLTEQESKQYRARQLRRETAAKRKKKKKPDARHTRWQDGIDYDPRGQRNGRNREEEEDEEEEEEEDLSSDTFLLLDTRNTKKTKLSSSADRPNNKQPVIKSSATAKSTQSHSTRLKPAKSTGAPIQRGSKSMTPATVAEPATKKTAKFKNYEIPQKIVTAITSKSDVTSQQAPQSADSKNFPKSLSELIPKTKANMKRTAVVRREIEKVSSNSKQNIQHDKSDKKSELGSKISNSSSTSIARTSNNTSIGLSPEEEDQQRLDNIIRPRINDTSESASSWPTHSSSRTSVKNARISSWCSSRKSGDPHSGLIQAIHQSNSSQSSPITSSNSLHPEPELNSAAENKIEELHWRLKDSKAKHQVEIVKRNIEMRKMMRDLERIRSGRQKPDEGLKDGATISDLEESIDDARQQTLLLTAVHESHVIETEMELAKLRREARSIPYD